jgi:hypothetical protein
MPTQKHKIDQPYASFQHFQAKHRITHPPKETWRLTQYGYIGEINGIPGSRGILVATDGTLCYITQGEQAPFLGHIQFFKPDEVEITAEQIRENAMKGKKPSLKEEELNRLLDEYQ